MAIKIGVFTVVLNKAAVAEKYRGGVEAFRRDHECVEDEYLFGLRTMSGEELHKIVEGLAAAGIELATCGAIGEMFSGAVETHPDIEFVQLERFPPSWEARLHK